MVAEKVVERAIMPFSCVVIPMPFPNRLQIKVALRSPTPSF